MEVVTANHPVFCEERQEISNVFLNFLVHMPRIDENQVGFNPLLLKKTRSVAPVHPDRAHTTFSNMIPEFELKWEQAKSCSPLFPLRCQRTCRPNKEQRSRPYYRPMLAPIGQSTTQVQ